MSLSTRISHLFRVFHPHSVAVVGASRDPKKIGHIVLKNIIDGGFTGEVYPVNPAADSILDMPVFASYDALPVTPHLAIVAVPETIVLQAVEEIAKKGTKGIVIFTAGFKEAGEEGEKRERDLAALADVYDLTIIGPNCLGFYHKGSKLNATFARMHLPDGNIRFVSQSGAMVSSFSDFAEGAGLGVEEIITIGNKTVIGEAELLTYIGALKQKRKKIPNESLYEPIGLYLESLTNGRAFVRAAKALSTKEPIILLKPGKSDAAKSAMVSHTGAVAGEEAVLQAALTEAGIIRADGVEDMFDLLRVFSWENAPKGSRVAIISNAGGPAVIASDALHAAGLTVAPLDNRVTNSLAKILPRMAAVHNPVDVLGDATSERYREAFRVLAPEKTVDAILVILTPQLMTDIAQIATVIGEASEKYGKPIVASFMGGARVEEGEKILNAYAIPSFRYPERAAKALGAMWAWESRKKIAVPEAPKENRPVRRASETLRSFFHTMKYESRSVLLNHEASYICRELGVSTPETHSMQNANDAHVLARRLAYDVILKIDSARTIHKTDVHGVITSIHDEEGFSAGWHEAEKVLHALHKKGDTHARLLLQERIHGGLEVFVGGKQDPDFGSVIVVGVGGTLTEVIGKHVMCLAPVSRHALDVQLRGTPLHTLLHGFRGEKAYAIEELYHLVEQISLFLSCNPEVKELDMNPVMVTHEKAYAVDVKIVLS